MADAPSGDLRSTIIAELAGTTGESAAPVEEAAAQDEAVEEAPAETEEVETAADDVEAGPEDDAPVDEDEPADDDEVELKSDDPKEQKLFDNVRRAEKRMREAAARRDADFEKKQAEWQSKVDRVAELDRLLARAKYDPIALLKAAGVTADDFELIAQSIYAESPALQNDPKQKAAAMAKLKAREAEDKYTALEKKQAELEAKVEQQKKDAIAQAETARYVQEINTAAASKFPLVARLLKDDPNDTNDALIRTYNTLGTKLNRAPKPSEVVAAYDKAERARLTKLGIDPNAIAKAKPAPVAAVKKPANGNTPPAPKPANGHKKMTPQEERDAILAEIEAAKSAQA